MLIVLTGLVVIAILVLIGLNARAVIKTGTTIGVICAILLVPFSAYGILSYMNSCNGKILSITATQEKNENSQGADIGIKAISVGGSQIDLTKSQYADEWFYQNETLSWGYTNQRSIYVTIPIYDAAEIQFVSNQWAGIVEISDGESTQDIDLYTPTETIYSFYVEKGSQAEITQFVIKTAGLVAVSSILIFLFFIFVFSNTKQNEILICF